MTHPQNPKLQIAGSRPVERCGDTIATAIGHTTTECVLRPGHTGSHADDHGTRWRLTEPTVDTGASRSALNETCCVCRNAPASYRNYRGQPFCQLCANCQCSDAPCIHDAARTQTAAEAIQLDPHQRYRLDIEAAIGLNAGGTGTAMVHAIRDAVLEVRDQQLRDWRRKALLRCLEISRLQGVVEGARHLLGDDISREDAWGDGYRAAQADLREILDTLNPQEQP